MKKKTAQYFDLAVESINYVILSYALANMAFLLQANLLYILFFASELWLTTNYWNKAKALTESKAMAFVLLILCFLVHFAMVYFVGHVS